VARRLVRIGLWSLVGLVGLIVAGAVIGVLSFDPDSLKPRLIAAVKQATGRDLTLQGHMRLAISLRPTLTVQGVGFANPSGFAPPQMATLQQLDVTLALLPLLSHRVEIDRVVLKQPDIILETDAQGRPNWQFTPEPATGAPSAGTAAPGQEHATTRLIVSDVLIEDGKITWHDGRTGRSAVIAIGSLRASAASPDADLLVSMQAAYNGAPFTLAGTFGPLTGLQDQPAQAAWPVQAHLAAAGATLDVDGTIAQPQQARGYRLKLAAGVPDLAALAPFLPGASLPPLHDVHLAAQVADTGGPQPEISALSLRIGRTDLTGIAPGLRLDKLDATATGLDQPVQISAEGSFDGAPASLAGSLGPAVTLASGKVPLDLRVRALGSNLTVKGTAARSPDGRPSVQGEIAADTVDLDSLLAALPKTPPPAPGPAATPATAATPPPSAAPPVRTGVIPDTPIPFDQLRGADADLKLTIAQAILHGAAYRDIATHLDLNGGKLRLDPFSADLPGGHVDAALSADASQATPAVALKLRMPDLSVQALLEALKQPAFMTGTLHVQADLRGTGATPHALAASLGGALGVVMGHGTLDNRLFGSTLGAVLREANLLNLVGRGGTSEVQCFATRLDAANGIAAVRSLVLVSGLLTMDGGGSLNLGAETLDLRLRPEARIAGTGVVVPLRVSGSFRAPSVASDPAATVTQNAGTIAGALIGDANPLGIIAGVLGGKALSGEATVNCGTSASAAPSRPSLPVPKLPNVGGVLKQLFR
jgi:uncharacterized protein involved in outer membrane biogenesis